MTFGFGMGFPRAAAAAGGPSLNLQFAGATALDPLITFTRASTGTYYDSSGVLRVSPLNLLPYSEQFDNAAWVKSNATVSSNVMTAPDGTLTGDALIEDTTTSVHSVAEVASLVATTTYALSVFAKASTRTLVRVAGRIFSSWSSFPDATFDLVSGTVTSVSGAGTPTITNVGNGWFRCVVFGTASATNAGMSINLVLTGTNSTYTGDGTSGLYIWGAQLETGSTATTYIPTTGAVNSAPRFDYNPSTLAPLGLLIEESRTNLLPYSEQFDNAAWTKTGGATVTPNTSTAPDQTLTADTLTISQTKYVWTTSASPPANTYCYSAYYKSNGSVGVYYQLNCAGTGATVAAVNIDFATGTISTRFGTPVSSGIQSVGNGWYRVWIVGTHVSGPIAVYTISSTTTDDSVIVWGAQLEAGASPSSYIPTTTAAATRAADNASINTLTPWFNATEGTLYTQSQSAAEVTGNRSIAVIGDGTANNRLQIRQDSATVNSNFIVLAGVLNYFQSLTFASGAVNKAALAYATNNVNSSANGIAGTTDTSETIPTGLTKLDLGNLALVAYLNGYLRTVSYYPRRLSNAELQALTV
jgi:hypothetical protein